MRIIAVVIVLILIGGGITAYLLIKNQKLSAVELANVRTACSSCHGRVPDYEEASRVHDIHASLNCTRCHSGNRSVQAPTEPSPGQSPSSTKPLEGPPDIPHPLQGHEDCLSCHETSGGYAPQIPPSHIGRTNSTCTSCHTVSK